MEPYWLETFGREQQADERPSPSPIVSPSRLFSPFPRYAVVTDPEAPGFDFEALLKSWEK